MSTLSVPQPTYQTWQKPSSNDTKITNGSNRPSSRDDNGLLMKSTLAGVFGSQTSLSDLTGDSDPYHYTYKAYRNTPAQKPRTIENDNDFLNDINRSLTMPQIVVETPSDNHDFSKKVTISRTRLAQNTPTSTMRRQLIHTWAQIQLFMFGVIYGQLANRFFAKTFYPIPTSLTNSSVLSLTPQMLPWWVWGIFCVIVGTLVPYLDRTRPAWLEPGFFLPSKTFFYSSFAHTNSLAITATGTTTMINSIGGQKSFISRCDWNSAIRTFAAFLGLGLAVRKLQFSSLGQVASLWALVSPVLWFLLDGTWTGIVCGLGISAAGGALVTATAVSAGVRNYDDGAMLPMALCLYFCCALCFGNIGRRLMK